MKYELVGYQYRRQEIHPNTVNYGEFSEWIQIPETKVEEIMEYIRQGYMYEIRELYTMVK